MKLLFDFLGPAGVWGLAAAIPAVGAEWIYRKWPSEWPWWYGLPLWIPMQLAIGYCIYRLVSDQHTASLLDAFVFWAFSTTFIRVILSVVILHEPIKGGTWFALGMLVMARVAQVFWGR